MQTVASILLLLLTVAMTVQADDFSVHRSLPPLKDDRYFFDITTTASAYALKQALKDFTIDQSFKVIGENRFFMVIRSNTTAALRRLSFPAGSSVEQYPVETIAQFLGVYGAGSGWKDYNFQTMKWNQVLTYMDREMVLRQTLSMRSLEINIRAWVQMVEKAHDRLKPLSYPLLASYPPRVVTIVDMDENLLQKFLKDTMIAGPGGNRITLKRIVRI